MKWIYRDLNPSSQGNTQKFEPWNEIHLVVGRAGTSRVSVVWIPSGIVPGYRVHSLFDKLYLYPY
jgi:hypothetical protein